MHKAVVALLLVASLLHAAPADAWGFAGHRLIMRRALELLPAELKPFFDQYREEVIIRSVDPDLWRSVGWEDDPNHFLDFGVSEYGKEPFAALPRDYDAALQKFGSAVLKRNGLLPWRAAEEFGNLRRAFEGFARGSLYAISDVILFSGVTAHYFQDAHQPLHATDNFDGAQTRNNGIHARFERDLIERFESRLNLRPPPPTAIANPRDAAFDLLIDSHRLVAGILEADDAAKNGKDAYDDDYFEKLFVRVQPTLERQLSRSISATAGAIIGAWEAAGRPKPALRDARPVQRIRRP
ncbi:MAG TPA: hypothetical protein VH417_06645 [Vicinamibacterales bacterium]|jgi:hypothetical protein